ncbi:hypothetical protein [Oryza sativa Japonica Group]|uniref:Uncharacterized protein n=1 Tax=Oryza sativa subsp. japonica TaxID=39947 RepID=Q9LIZ3_ORYSJ|nr:hypothetical protein [Oryza sativa Japonica Group]
MVFTDVAGGDEVLRHEAVVDSRNSLIMENRSIERRAIASASLSPLSRRRPPQLEARRLRLLRHNNSVELRQPLPPPPALCSTWSPPRYGSVAPELAIHGHGGGVTAAPAPPFVFTANVRNHVGAKDGYYGNRITRQVVASTAGTRLINDDAKERMPGLLPNKQQHLMLLARAVRVELGRHRAVCRACHAREWTV